MSTESNAPENDAPQNDAASVSPSSDAGDPGSDHSDKYNDPRVKISKRGVMLGIAVVCFGVAGSALSIWARKTELDQTTAFFGPDTITALQLAEEVELLRSFESDANSPGSEQLSDPVRLSGMPGLGHLRHTLLDDRSYNWDSIGAATSEPATSDPAAEASDAPSETETMVIRLTDPTAHRFPETNLIIQLDSGWVRLAGADEKVQLNDRFRTALPTFLKRVANYEPLRSEVRARKAAEAAKDAP